MSISDSSKTVGHSSSSLTKIHDREPPYPSLEHQVLISTFFIDDERPETETISQADHDEGPHGEAASARTRF